MRKGTAILAAVIVVLGLLIFPSAGGRVTAAGPWYVATTGNDSNSCLSPASPCRTIQAAVNKAANGDVINVGTGTYAEQVLIHRREGLRINGEPGAQMVPPAGSASGSLVSLFLSREITLRGLTLTGSGVGPGGPADNVGGISISQSQAISLGDCTVEDMGGGGIVLFDMANAQIRNCIIRRNRFHGVRVDGTSGATLGTFVPTETVVIEDNLFTGVITGPGGGTLKFLGSVLIQRNQIGILGEGANIATCCVEQQLPLRILNNVIGLSLRGGHIELRVPAQIEGNQLLGVGLNGAAGSFGRFSGPSNPRIVVRNNGTAGDPTTGGIVMTGSHLDLFNTEVVDNPSRGVLLQDNSSTRLFNTLVSGNGGEGVRLEALSTARLFSLTSLQGNRGFDLSCTPNSFGAGDGSGVQRMFCPGFDRSPAPQSSEPGIP